MTKIDFEFETEYGVFRDALYLQDDQPSPSAVEIEAMKQQRLDNWIAAITALPVEEVLAEVSTQEV